jgi:hypothetical protein
MSLEYSAYTGSAGNSVLLAMIDTSDLVPHYLECRSSAEGGSSNEMGHSEYQIPHLKAHNRCPY